MNPIINLTNISAFVAIIGGSAYVWVHKGSADGFLFLFFTILAYLIVALAEYEIEKELKSQIDGYN